MKCKFRNYSSSRGLTVFDDYWNKIFWIPDFFHCALLCLISLVPARKGRKVRKLKFFK